MQYKEEMHLLSRITQTNGGSQDTYRKQKEKQNWVNRNQGSENSLCKCKGEQRFVTVSYGMCFRLFPKRAGLESRGWCEISIKLWPRVSGNRLSVRVCESCGYVCGAVSSGECWLLAYNVWLGVLTYSLFDFSYVEVVPALWGTPSLSPLSVLCSLWLLYLLAC